MWIIFCNVALFFQYYILLINIFFSCYFSVDPPVIHHTTNPQYNPQKSPTGKDLDRAEKTEQPVNVKDDDNDDDDDLNDAGPAENMCTGLPTISIVYNVLVHIVLYGYTIYISWISFFNKDPYSVFVWHAPLSLLGVSSRLN